MPYITAWISPFPAVCITTFPVLISLNAMFGFTNASLVIASSIYPDSVKSFFKNLYLTGVLKNKFFTVIDVPVLQPISSCSKTFPASTTNLVPISSFSVFVINSTFATAAILAKASPLNPIEWIVSMSLACLILLVACLSKAISVSSFAIPLPLSVIRIKDIPPFFISTVIAVAPASIEFSTISFTTEAGLSITSPAAILFIVNSSNKTIFPIYFFSFSYIHYHSARNYIIIFLVTQ